MLELLSPSHRKKNHINLHWKFSSYLLAISLSRSLLKSLKSTCINFGIPSRRLEKHMLTTSRWKTKKEDLLTFIKELGYSGKCDMLSTIQTDQMHQPWRTFAAVINRCISRKSTGLDRLRESRAQILWVMYNLKNADYVALL
ncbi:hypothetical protein Tco_0362644 [Tanacetum coccineum]